MRFHIGPVPVNEGFCPEEDGWTQLRLPPPSVLLWGQILGALVLGIAIYLLHSRAKSIPLLNDIKTLGLWAIPAYVPSCCALVALHEVVHLLLHPGAGRSSSSTLGVWPSKGVAYAFYDDVMTRQRAILTTAAPLIALSGLPGAGLLLFGRPDSALWAAVVGNALLSAGDVMLIVLVATQVPGAAVLRNKGWSTWWREPQHLEHGRLRPLDQTCRSRAFRL